ncbi:hypothetical protein DFS34DRAFT_2880 [Phlyctochytrium arcticum]|nr:hypothetical protein DFS34DRAFT_2880 [Phlyctochytrium arcticum]
MASSINRSCCCDPSLYCDVCNCCCDGSPFLSLRSRSSSHSLLSLSLRSTLSSSPLMYVFQRSCLLSRSSRPASHRCSSRRNRSSSRRICDSSKSRTLFRFATSVAIMTTNFSSASFWVTALFILHFDFFSDVVFGLSRPVRRRGVVWAMLPLATGWVKTYSLSPTAAIPSAPLAALRPWLRPVSDWSQISCEIRIDKKCLSTFSVAQACGLIGGELPKKVKWAGEATFEMFQKVIDS